MELTNIPQVTVQFRIARRKHIPDVLFDFESVAETADESIARFRRNQQGTGVLIDRRNKRCDVSGLRHQLEDAGYTLANLTWQMRRDRDRPTVQYASILFIFRAAIDANGNPVSVDVHPLQKELQRAFDELVNDAYWQIRLFDNPLDEHDGAENGRSLLIWLGSRLWRYKRVEDPETGEERYVVPRHTLFFSGHTVTLGPIPEASADA